MQMCPLITEVHKDILALTTDTTVTIGTIDKIQKLHIRSFWRVSAPHMLSGSDISAFVVISSRYFNDRTNP